jgi:hypothetical protein
MSKYGNRQSAASDGKVFSSARERNRYEELRLLWKIGKITEPRCQPRYELIPKQHGERKVEYVADFAYQDKETGELHVEDSKGFRTKEYVIKRKLMLYLLKIRVEEV